MSDFAHGGRFGVLFGSLANGLFIKNSDLSGLSAFAERFGPGEERFCIWFEPIHVQFQDRRVRGAQPGGGDLYHPTSMPATCIKNPATVQITPITLRTNFVCKAS